MVFLQPTEYKRKFNLLFFFLVISLIFFIEPMEILGLKISVLWKLVGLLLVSFSLVLMKVQTLTKVSFLSLLMCLKTLIVITEVGYFHQVEAAVRFLFLPSVIFVLSRINIDTRSVATIVGFSAVFCSLPFYFGLIEPLGQGLTLGYYGVDDNSFVGPFLNAHNAAATYAFSAIVFVFNIFTQRRYLVKFLFLFVSIVAIIFLYKTYVRTGYLIFALGGSYIYFRWLRESKNSILLKFTITVFLLFVLAYLVSYQYQTDEVFERRLSDKYSEDYEVNLQTIGSGRITFWLTNLNYWRDFNIIEKFLGVGYLNAIDNMSIQLGQRIFSHNFFIDQLVQSGILGLLLYLYFHFLLFSLIFVRRYESEATLYQAFFVAYFVYNFIQGSNVFWLDVFVGTAVVFSYRARSISSGIKL